MAIKSVGILSHIREAARGGSTSIMRITKERVEGMGVGSGGELVHRARAV